MKEKIYTIPVTEAFSCECECPICILEKKLEDEYIDYMLGPSLMEPDGRSITNEKGFCTKHFEYLYNKQENRLGLGLTISTYLEKQNEKLKKAFFARKANLEKDCRLSVVKNISNKVTSKQTETEKFLDEIMDMLGKHQGECAICSKLDYTMDRYVEVILYLWFKEEDFRKLFNSKKGFCMSHFKLLLDGASRYLGSRDKAEFLTNLFEMQIQNMERIQQEVDWFTKKFDYKNNGAPWGNSKDAVPRSIKKVTGNCNLK